MKTSPSSRLALLGLSALCSLTVLGCGERKTAEAPAGVKMTDAENSNRNVQDRGDATLTSGDQGSSAADRAITQKIRQALIANDAYSTTAKNIKIITVDGRVTLRGPVNTMEEKTAIGALAETHATARPIDNQLEVKTRP